jgi:hypothetical protein
MSTIPNEWNLTDEQKTNMINAQQKVIEENNKIRIKQQDDYKAFLEHASLSPPEYPILVVIKDSNLTSVQKQILKDTPDYKYYYYKQYFLQSNNNYVYSNSFDDAIQKVKTELANKPNNKNRISSDNIKGPPQTNNFSLIPNSSYKIWEINITNAPASMFSSFKKTIRKLGGKKRRSNKLKKKSKKRSKKSKKRYY